MLRPRNPAPEIEDVFESWEISGLAKGNLPATEEDLRLAEQKLGFQIPGVLRALYEVADGMEPLRGNLQVEPLLGRPPDQLSLVGYRQRLVAWGWPVPSESLPFGGNGSGDVFALWLGAMPGTTRDPPVIQIGQIFEPRSFAIVGTSLSRFLRTWSAYYLLLLDAPPEALDALGLPFQLRRPDDELDDAAFSDLLAWSDPDLPDTAPDPYSRGMTRDELIAVLGP